MVNSPERVGRACACDWHEGNGACELAAVRRAKIELSVLIWVPRGCGDVRNTHEVGTDETLRRQVSSDCGDGTAGAQGILCLVDGPDAKDAIKALFNARSIGLCVSVKKRNAYQ